MKPVAILFFSTDGRLRNPNAAIKYTPPEFSVEFNNPSISEYSLKRPFYKFLRLFFLKVKNLLIMIPIDLAQSIAIPDEETGE